MVKPELKLSIYGYEQEIAATFKGECEEFLQEYEALNTLSFEDFANIWRRRNFTYVFAGQKYALLLKELCENYFYVVKKFVMFPRSIHTQVGALYMLYSLYYKQPLRTWVKIRLTLNEFRRLSELVEQLKDRRQLDAVYIFARMKMGQAFVYTALHKPLGPEDRFVKSYQPYFDDTFSSSKTESALTKFNELPGSELVAELEKTNDEYQRKMKEFAKRDASITPFASSIVKDIRNAHALNTEGGAAEGSAAEVEVEGAKKSLRQAIREKAFTSNRAVYRACRKVKMAVDEDILEFQSK